MGQPAMSSHSTCVELTSGSETSQYREERKSNETPKVAASEMGRAQTGVRALRGSDCIIDLLNLAEWSWEDQPESVKAT